MAGTRAGCLKTAETIKKKYGPDYYKEMGRRGGEVWGLKKGFAANTELAREQGKKTKRGKNKLKK